MLFIDTPIEFLKGVGPSKADLLHRELDIYTFGDLLEYFPFRYVDRSKVSSIAELNPDEPYVVLKGTIYDMHTVGNGKSTRLTAQLRDKTGQIELVWFQGIKWIKDSLKPDVEYTVMGKPTIFNDRINIAHPDIERADADNESNRKYIPIYSSTEKLKAKGLHTKGIARLTEQLLRMAHGKIPETLPLKILQKYKLPSRGNAIEIIHYPLRPHDIALSMQRMKFEELFFLQLDYQYSKRERHKRSNGYIFPVVGEKFNRFYNERLNFELTGAQKRVVKEIRSDMKSGHQMNRLLQGDVGSGKTMVAVLTSLIAVANGYQACLMAPTEVLAFQHFNNISKYLAPTGVKAALLTGSTGTAARREIHAGLEDGSIGLIVGTHALIEDTVVFKSLGLAIVDEQHRFGVDQRARLWAKGAGGIPPHVLVMTATPIPRTLAMTLYGDLDISVIDEMPPGRKPVQTLCVGENKRAAMYNFIRDEIAKGRQAFIVYPLIFESEKVDYKNLELGYEEVLKQFPQPQYQVAMVHGKQTAEEKAFHMDAFVAGRANILVSTTVIEVGVDVPNASVMVIESAERFGLSQLHQLRGRVGRGAEKSFCILMKGYKVSKESQKRLDLMCATENGFEIAEEDMKMRGPGDLEGTQQSGLPIALNIASLARDGVILSDARLYAEHILEQDPALEKPGNASLAAELRKDKYVRKDYSQIS